MGSQRMSRAGAAGAGSPPVDLEGKLPGRSDLDSGPVCFAERDPMEDRGAARRARDAHREVGQDGWREHADFRGAVPPKPARESPSCEGDDENVPRSCEVAGERANVYNPHSTQRNKRSSMAASRSNDEALASAHPGDSGREPFGEEPSPETVPSESGLEPIAQAPVEPIARSEGGAGDASEPLAEDLELAPGDRGPQAHSAVHEPPSSGTRRGFWMGQVLDGKYRIDRLIGEGAMGIVLAATHLGLDEVVAIKLIRADLQRVPGTLSRFAKEAKIAAKIRNEHVCKLLDVGESEEIGPYIVMEYLEGRSLGDMGDAQGRLPIDRAVEYVLQACEALAAAHSLGVTHRDIKPENLFLTRQGNLEVIKLLDFGISKAALTGHVFGDDLSLTKTSYVVGTPLYMSPEQVRSAPNVDYRTDIWSIGAVLYELVTGETAFSAASVTEICAKIIEQPTPRIANLLPHAPAALQPIIGRCLEKDASRRYQTVAELAAALAPLAPLNARLYAERSSSILRGSTLDLRARLPPGTDPSERTPGAVGSQSAASLEPTPAWHRASHPRSWGVGAAAAALALALALAAWLSESERAPYEGSSPSSASPPVTSHRSRPLEASSGERPAVAHPNAASQGGASQSPGRLSRAGRGPTAAPPVAGPGTPRPGPEDAPSEVDEGLASNDRSGAEPAASAGANERVATPAPRSDARTAGAKPRAATSRAATSRARTHSVARTQKPLRAKAAPRSRATSSSAVAAARRPTDESPAAAAPSGAASSAEPDRDKRNVRLIEAAPKPPSRRLRLIGVPSRQAPDR